ncbi:MAG: hypothetical protein RIT81_29825 [Deltaproteobacteria bacterium]
MTAAIMSESPDTTLRTAKYFVAIRGESTTNLRFNGPVQSGDTGVIGVTDDAMGRLQITFFQLAQDPAPLRVIWKVELTHLGATDWMLVR